MMRSVAVIYLILTTLVGPRLCPCSTLPLGGGPSSPAVGPVRDDLAPRSCRCCDAPRPADTSPRERGEPRPEPPSGPCHCRCGAAIDAIARPVPRSELTGVSSDLDFIGFVGSVFGLPPLLLASTEGTTRGTVDPRFAATHDLLHVFHNLRC